MCSEGFLAVGREEGVGVGCLLGRGPGYTLSQRVMGLSVAFLSDLLLFLCCTGRDHRRL